MLKAEVELRRAEKEEEAENAELRKQIARISKRQADVLIETKKLIRAEIETYLNSKTRQIVPSCSIAAGRKKEGVI